MKIWNLNINMLEPDWELAPTEEVEGAKNGVHCAQNSVQAIFLSLTKKHEILDSTEWWSIKCHRLGYRYSLESLTTHQSQLCIFIGLLKEHCIWCAYL
jgi:hypothetical protein